MGGYTSNWPYSIVCRHGAYDTTEEAICFFN